MRRISLWLIPCEEDYSFLDVQIQSIKNKFNGDELFPHVSLPFSCAFEFEEIFSRLEKVEFKKIELIVSKIGLGVRAHQQVFLEFEENNGLNELTQSLLEIFDDLIVKTRDKAPHLSMVYADKVGLYSEEEKIKIKSEIKVPKKIMLDKIALVDLPSKNPQDWKILKLIKLI
jgi:hypothetical protein